MDIRKMAQQVRSFQKASGQVVNKKPTTLEVKEVQLRYDLMREENIEYQDAGLSKNKVEILDACADQLYILLGTINAHGLQDLIGPAFELVHKNNMTKVGPDGKVLRNPDGKILKPQGFVPVDLTTLFKQHDL
jgi:predicted HAD superfamily Cof-like phosphohydrolase